MIVDGLEINNWNRSTIEEVKSGGIDAVSYTHLTLPTTPYV